MTQPIDLLITGAELLTMRGEGVGYVPGGAVAIDAGRIVEAGDASIAGRYAPRETITAGHRAIMPGLIDVHMHTQYAAVRGVAQDVGNWMQAALAPYSKHLTPAAAEAGTRLNVFEALRSGTTTFGDYLRPYPGWGEIYRDAGVRAVLTPSINAFPPGGMAGWGIGDLYPLDAGAGADAIALALEFVDRWQGAADGRITTMLGPQGPDMLDEAQLQTIREAAIERGIGIHMHVAQGDREVDQMVLRYGERPAAFLERIGYLDGNLLAVHLTEATDEETDRIAASGARMALCSGSIGIIDGIVPPAKRFMDAGGVVGLGSDQASGNNCNNIFNEMKLTALFNKIKYRDPQAMPAWAVLRMGTIGGARALGIDDSVGSIEAGKQADLVFIDLDEPNLMPVLDAPVRTLVPNLVYAGTGREVSDVMVAGRFVVREREMLTMDPDAIRDAVRAQSADVSARVGADPMHEDLTLVHATRAGLL